MGDFRLCVQSMFLKTRPQGELPIRGTSGAPLAARELCVCMCTHVSLREREGLYRQLQWACSLRGSRDPDDSHGKSGIQGPATRY